MREILFRGKMKSDNGENEKGSWIFGHYCELTDGNKIIPCIYKKGEVIKDTVGQYTGLTDKNGNKIFEGDIVNRKGYVYYCKWDEYNYEYAFDDGDEDFGIGYTAPYELEIIGNIHDNPELLKGESKNA